MLAMKKANIGELRNRLSYYLRFVRRGQSVMVCDRDRVFARIEPVRDAGVSGDSDKWPAELVQSGILLPPSQKLGRQWLRGRVRTSGDVVAALLAERASGR
jgi:antitoxin (DNA-binding transcriptional repressor) of toxin-antitoxin stability system